LWWSVAWARHATKQNSQRELQVQQLQSALEDRNKAIDTLADQLSAEETARWRAEEAARRAMHRLARDGDPAAVADALGDELRALADMSTPASRARRYEASAVHGEIDTGGRTADDTKAEP
jgi:hypothetical protein